MFIDSDDDTISSLSSSPNKSSQRVRKSTKRVIDDDSNISPVPKKTKVSPFDTNLWNQISDDVFFHGILLFLPFNQLLRIRLICKYFDRLVLAKWLSNPNCKLIPNFKLQKDGTNIACDLTNLMVSSAPQQELFKFYSKFQNVMHLYCKNLLDCYLMKGVAFKRLESLYLMSCNLTGADIILLFQSNHLTNLKTICLDKNNLRGDGHFDLILNRNTCPKLETLSVASNCLSDDCTVLFRNENISNLPINFHTLIIHNNQITVKGQFTLLTNEKFRILSIDGKSDSSFYFTKPLQLKYLKVEMSFHHNTEMTCNTTISEKGADFPKLDNGMYLEYVSVRRFVLLQNLDYYFENNFMKDSIDMYHPERYFYIKKLLKAANTPKRRGELYEMKKDWKNAISEYNISNLPERIALIYFRKMNPPNYDLALIYFLQFNSNTNECNAEIATICYELRKFEMAKDYLEKDLPKLSPKSLELLGACCYQLKQYSKTIEYLSRCFLTQEDSKFYLAYSILEVDDTKKDVAVEMLLDLAKRRNNQAIHFLGKIYENGLYSFGKDIGKSIEFYSLLENNDLGKYALGKIYSNLDKEKAIKVLRTIDHHFDRYGEVSCMLGILLKDINQEEACDFLATSASLGFQDCIQPIIDHLCSSISYDWNFILPSKFTKTRKLHKSRDLFKEQFSHSVTPENNYNLISLVKKQFNNYNFDITKAPHIQIARFFFLLGEFNESDYYYQQLMDTNEEAQKFFLFFAWFSELDDIPENRKPIIEKHLETNIYAQYLFTKHNLNGDPTRSKMTFEKCQHIFDMSNYEVILAMNFMEDEKVVSLCQSSLMSYSIETVEIIINYSIERDLIDLQRLIVSALEDHYEYDEALIPLECSKFIREGNEKHLLRTLFLSYPNKRVFETCLKHTVKKSRNEMFELLLNFQSTQDNEPGLCFYSELIWVLFINGRDSEVLEYSRLLFPNDQELEKLLTNKYDQAQLLLEMYRNSFSYISKKIYLQKHPNISKVFDNSNSIHSLISNAVEENIIQSYDQSISIFDKVMNLNLANRKLAEIAFSLKLGKKAVEYYEKSSDFSNVGHTFCQGFPDLPIDYNEAIKNFKKAIYIGNDTETYFYNLGCCYLELKQYGESISYFSKTTFPESYANLAKCYIAIRNYNSALNNLKMIEIQQVDDNDIKFNYATCYQELGKKLNNKEYGKIAVEIFTSIQDVNPEAKQHVEELNNFLTIENITASSITPTLLDNPSSDTLEFDDE